MKPTGPKDEGNAVKNRSIFDFFKPHSKQTSNVNSSLSTTGPSCSITPVVKVPCPGCSELVSQARINWHLDQDCKSRLSAKQKKKKKGKTVKKDMKKEIEKSDKITNPTRRKNVKLENEINCKIIVPKIQVKCILSDSDDDFVSSYADGYESPSLFDLPSSLSTSPNSLSSSNCGVFFNSSMVETLLHEDDDDFTNLVETPCRDSISALPCITVKSMSALKVESMLKDDWQFDDDSNLFSKSPFKRKTFELQPSQPFVPNYQPLNEEFEQESRLQIEPLANTNLVSGSMLEENTLYHKGLTNYSPPRPFVLASAKPDDMCLQSDDSDDFEPLSQSFRTPIEQKRTKSRSPSKTSKGKSPDISYSSLRNAVEVKNITKINCCPKNLKKKISSSFLKVSDSKQSLITPTNYMMEAKIINSVHGHASTSVPLISCHSNDSSLAVDLFHLNPLEQHPKEEPSLANTGFVFPSIQSGSEVPDSDAEFDSSGLYSPLDSPTIVSPNRTPSPSPYKKNSEELLNCNSSDGANSSKVFTTRKQDIKLNGCQIGSGKLFASNSAFDSLLTSDIMINAKMSSCVYPRMQMSEEKRQSLDSTPSKGAEAARILEQNNVRLSSSIKRNLSQFGLSQGSLSKARESSSKKKSDVTKDMSQQEERKNVDACRNLFQIATVVGNYKKFSEFPLDIGNSSTLAHQLEPCPNDNFNRVNDFNDNGQLRQESCTQAIQNITNSPQTTPLKLHNSLSKTSTYTPVTYTLTNSPVRSVDQNSDSLSLPLRSSIFDRSLQQSPESNNPIQCQKALSGCTPSSKIITPTKTLGFSSKLSTSHENTSSPSGVHSPAKSTPSEGNRKPEDYRHHTGYYLDNFLTVVDTVCASSGDYKLFNEEEKSIIATFHSFSLAAKKLYVRLFQRTVEWKRVSKIDYPDICDKEDVCLYVKELSYAHYLLLESELSDPERVLLLLSGEEVTTLCRERKVPTAGRNKSDLVDALLRNSKEQPTIIMAFFKAGAAGSHSLLLNRAKKMLGSCCLLNRAVRRVFLRLITLYALPRYDEDDETGQQHQLVTLLRINIGQVKYPSGVARLRETDIFRCREDLLGFERCQEVYSAVKEALESQNWQQALDLCADADKIYLEFTEDQELVSHDGALPRFLRRYTSLSLLVYLRTCQVEALQRLRKYSEAIKVLRSLLAQHTHLQDFRGAWYDRLALNLDQHLKMKEKALEVVCAALRDPEVRVGHRLSLSLRGQKLLAGKAKWAAKARTGRRKIGQGGENSGSDEEDRVVLEGVQFMEPREAPKVVIEGRCFQIASSGVGGFRRVFLTGESAAHSGLGDVTACSVEELAIAHYKQRGYTEGLHAEGSTSNSLFALLFWSCVYESPVADAFRLPHQAAPLDLDYPNFYESRKEQIDNRLSQVSDLTEAQVLEEVTAVWELHHGEACIINWDLFRSPGHAVSLIVSLGLPVVTAMCLRLAVDHRFTRSGFPDLIVWNPAEKESRIVEVKGPNDRLSSKQVLWLDYLLQHGACAEVCHVEAIGAKMTASTEARTLSPSKKSQSASRPETDDHQGGRGSRKTASTEARTLSPSKKSQSASRPETDDHQGGRGSRVNGRRGGKQGRGKREANDRAEEEDSDDFCEQTIKPKKKRLKFDGHNCK